MISVRNAFYCNLKAFLIYLVVLGHMTEPRIEESCGLQFVYKLIYTFHMPLFAFLTGVFVKSPESCKRQGLRLLKLYLLLQLFMVAITWGGQKPFTPYWHLWYLLSSGWWMLFGWLWFRFGEGKWAVPLFLAGVAAGCLVGYVPQINRVLSLSRTIVFFPFFFWGLLSEPGLVLNSSRRTGLGLGVLSVILFLSIWRKLPASFFYQAEGYGDLSYGWVYRLGAYFIGMGFSAFLLTFVPRKRLTFTKLGADTLGVYLLHGPIVLVLRRIPMPWYGFPFLSFLVPVLIQRGECWLRKVYGIREGGCRSFKKRKEEWPVVGFSKNI